MNEEKIAEEKLEKPVSRGEIIIYGSGAICNGMAMSVHKLLTPLMVLVLGMNPILAGAILAIKTLWDGFTDPIMASITDNARTRWGRRRPFILVGGILTVVLSVSIWTFIPVGENVKPNVQETAVAEQASTFQETTGDHEEVTGTESTQKNNTSATSAVPTKAKKKSLWKSIQEGSTLLKETSADQKKIFYFLTIAMLMLATTHTMFSVPYYALGIELSPSYHGRTRVVAYRAVFEKFQHILYPWYLPFCMMGIFSNAIVGTKWLMVILAGIVLPAVILSSLCTRERTQQTKAKKKVNIFSSIALTVKNRHFLKIAALYIILQLCMGLFLEFGLYINIFHVFGGDQDTAMKFGALMQAKVGSMGAIIALLSIPFITWVCKRFQKHNALRLALITTAIGCILNWFCYTPKNPNLQFILPFFFALGISSTYTVLGTLMADVTDIDELNTGSRREGMFGAVMAWMSKGVGTIQALGAGALLVATGFNAQLGSQTPETILGMRVLFSFAPAACLLLALLLLHRYPLTRERMEKIKELIQQRKETTALPQE
jgi:GPH family glycoside/pentoside/hexuronide:cation symporter